MVIKVYIAGVTCNNTIRNHQHSIINYLESKKIPFESIDVAASEPDTEEHKKFMRKNSKPAPGQTVPLPPQVFNDDEYCGDYDTFFEYQEDNKLDVFFKLATETETSTASVEVTGGQKSGGDDQVQQEEQ